MADGSNHHGIVTTGDLFPIYHAMNGTAFAPISIKDLSREVAEDLATRGVALVRFDKDKFFCGSQELDRDHPETWGRDILAQMALEALKR